MGTVRVLGVTVVLVLAAASCGDDGGGDEVAGSTTATTGSSTVTEPEDADPATSGTLDTALGPMAWESIPLDGAVTFVAPYADGYVGLLDGAVASSVDGITWERWADQPEVVGDYPYRALAVDGDEVVVVLDPFEGPRPPLVFAAAGDGPWRELLLGAESIVSELVRGSLRRTVRLGSGESGLFLNWGLTWVRSGDEFVVTGDEVLLPLSLDANVPTVWTGLIPPSDRIEDIAERDGRWVALRGVQEAPTTSTDGQSWWAIAPIAVPYPDDECYDPLPVLSAQIVEAGPLGWTAVGLIGCAPSVTWLSADGVTWEPLDGFDGPDEPYSSFSAPAPPGPTPLVEADRILIYGQRARTPTVWVLTPTGDEEPTS